LSNNPIFSFLNEEPGQILQALITHFPVNTGYEPFRNIVVSPQGLYPTIPKD